MVIFIPYYRQHGQLFHSRPSTTANGHQPTPIKNSQIVFNILCRFAFSLLLLMIVSLMIRSSIYHSPNQNEGSPIIAAVLFTIAIVSFIRTCQKLRQYYQIIDTRRQLVQRAQERQQISGLALPVNNNGNPELMRNVSTDLPSYKELFPSYVHLNDHDNDPSSLLPSYDDYVKTLAISHSIPNLPSCICITDRTRRPLCIRNTITYV